MLPDRSILIGQKLVENAKIAKFKCDILGDFQTLCVRSSAFYDLIFSQIDQTFLYHVLALLQKKNRWRIGAR